MQFLRMRRTYDSIPVCSIGMRLQYYSPRVKVHERLRICGHIYAATYTAMAEGEEKLLAEFPGVRHKKQDGVLLLTSARVAWSSGGGERLQLNFPYPQIKGSS